MPRVQWFIGMNTSEAERAMKRLEKKMKKFSRSAQRTGKAMMKYISLPLIGLGAAAGKSANDVDEAFQNIARGTGATGKQLQNLKKDWKEMADQVVQGFDESSNVFADINTRLGITGEKLQQVTENALDTARMFGEDVNTVVDASTKVFNDWNIEAENYTKLQDKMFKASQKSGISVSKLNEIIVKYGTYMRQAGFSIEDAIALVSQFEKQGIYTQRVLRGLRTGIKDLADKGIEDLAGTMQGYIEKIKNAKTETEAFSLANDIFGKSANDIVDAIHSGAFELKDFKNALENVDGAIQDADKNTKTFTEKWAQLQNTAKLALVPIGKRLMDLANTIIPKVLAKVEDLGEIIEGMSDESVSNLQKLAGVLIGSGGLIFAIGKVTSAFATMGTIIVGLASGPAAPIIVATTAAWGLYHALHKVILEQEKFAHIRPAEEIRHSGKFEDTVQNAWQSLYGRENPDKGIQTQKFYEISQALQNAVMHGKDFNKVVQTIYDLEGPTENQKIAAENRLRDFYDNMTSKALNSIEKDVLFDRLFDDKNLTNENLMAFDRIGTMFERAVNEGEKLESVTAKINELEGVSNKRKEKAIELLRRIYEMKTKEEAATAGEGDPSAEASMVGDTKGEAKKDWEVLAEEYKRKFQELLASGISNGIQDGTKDGTEKSEQTLREWLAQFDYWQMPAAMQAINNTPKFMSDAWLAAQENARSYGQAVVDVGKQQEEIQENAEDLVTTSDLWTDRLAAGLARAIVQGENLRDTLSNILQQLASSYLQNLIGGFLPFGNKNAANPLTSPPSQRMLSNATANNQSGVVPASTTNNRTTNAETNNITVNVNALDVQSFTDALKHNKATIESAIVDSIASGGSVRKAIRGYAN